MPQPEEQGGIAPAPETVVTDQPVAPQMEYVAKDPEQLLLEHYLEEYAELSTGEVLDLPATLTREARLLYLNTEIHRLTEKLGKSPLEKVTRSVVNRVTDILGSPDYHQISRREKIGAALTASTAALVKWTPEYVPPVIKSYRKGEAVVVAEKKRHNLLEEAFVRGVPPGRLEGTFTKYEILNFMQPIPDFTGEQDEYRKERLKFARAARYMDAYVLERGYAMPPVDQLQATIAEVVNQGFPFERQAADGTPVQEMVPFCQKVVKTRTTDGKMQYHQEAFTAQDVRVIDLRPQALRDNPQAIREMIDRELRSLPGNQPVMILKDTTEKIGLIDKEEQKAQQQQLALEYQLLDQLLSKNPFVVYLDADNAQILVNHEYFNQTEARWLMTDFFEKTGIPVQSDFELAHLDNALGLASERMNMGVEDEDYCQTFTMLDEFTLTSMDLVHKDLQALLKKLLPEAKISRATVRELIVQASTGADKSSRLKFNPSIRTQLSNIPIEFTIFDIIRIAEAAEKGSKKALKKLQTMVTQLQGDGLDNMEFVTDLLDHMPPAWWANVNNATKFVIAGQQGLAGTNMTSVYPEGKYMVYGRELCRGIGGPAESAYVHMSAATLNPVTVQASPDSPPEKRMIVMMKRARSKTFKSPVLTS